MQRRPERERAAGCMPLRPPLHVQRNRPARLRRAGLRRMAPPATPKTKRAPEKVLAGSGMRRAERMHDHGGDQGR